MYNMVGQVGGLHQSGPVVMVQVQILVMYNMVGHVHTMPLGLNVQTRSQLTHCLHQSKHFSKILSKNLGYPKSPPKIQKKSIKKQLKIQKRHQKSPPNPKKSV